MIEPKVKEQMQREWNERARQDAHFYVAFGRRDQDPEEFFATAADMVRSLSSELKRLPPGTRRRALEIGCGPGRLLKPMSRFFTEIHGIDVSDEMIARAQANLADIPHAYAHHGSGADLALFSDGYFDFVYSYAVFQHIPSRAVVMQYLHESNRVLAPAGLIRVQVNGLDDTAHRYDTWSGVRISADEIREFARETGLLLLALEGARTQYMWATLRKPAPVRVRRVTNAQTSEPVVPAGGRFSSVTVWIENLPEGSDLLTLNPTVDGMAATATYIGPREADGLQQVNLMLPKLARTGLVPVELQGCPPIMLRVIPAGPQVPRLVSIADGVNLLGGTKITSGSVKITVEETDRASEMAVLLDGVRVKALDVFCVDPQLPRYEVNFELPAKIKAGPHSLSVQLGRRLLASLTLDVNVP